MEIKEKKFMIGDKESVIRIGEYAWQANGSVVLQCGETLVQAIVTMGNENPDLDFFPLTVEYNENLYAGGTTTRALQVEKMRGTNVNNNLVPYTIDANGIEIFPAMSIFREK